MSTKYICTMCEGRGHHWLHKAEKCDWCNATGKLSWPQWVEKFKGRVIYGYHSHWRLPNSTHHFLNY